LLIFALGVFDVLLLGFDMSLRTGLMLKMGMHPHSFINAAIVLLLASVRSALLNSGGQRVSGYRS
jgi:hypothetical protein